jgi:hypothetical protein
VAALRTLDAEGLFGEGDARSEVALLVLCGDMSSAFFLRGMKKLNPPQVVERYLLEQTPEPLYRRLDALPREERLHAYLGVFVDLALDRASPLAAEARRRHLTYFGELGPKIAEQGPDAVNGLLAIIETYAFGPTFHERGTPEYERHGAFTLADQLATSAVFLLGEIGMRGEADISRLQSIVRRRVELDARVQGPVSTLPANAAYVLHELHPARFPEPRMSASTNRLENPAPFLEAAPR